MTKTGANTGTVPTAPLDAAAGPGADRSAWNAARSDSPSDARHDTDVHPDERAPRLRPLSVGQIVDGGYRGLRARPGVVLGSGLLFLAPVTVLAGLAGGGLVGGVVTRGSVVGTVVNGVGTSFATFGMGLPLARVVAAAADGHRLGLGAALRLPARVWASAVVAWLVLAVAKVVGTAFFLLPGLVVVVFGLVVAPVLAVEQLGPFAALRRAAALAGTRFWRCVGVVALQVVATLGVAAALLVLPALVVSGLEDPIARPLGAVLQLGVSLVVMPTAALSTALAYLDLRVRAEGIDLDREIRRRERLVAVSGGVDHVAVR